MQTIIVLLGEWLARGPFGLAMSSGFFGFFAHTGMLSALVSRGFVPTHVAGSSAGSLVGGAYASGIAPDDLATILAQLDRTKFWDPSFGIGLLAGKKFDALLRDLLPIARIESTPRPVRISVFDILARKTVVLDRGDLPHAIRASCAVPAMFHPVWIDRRPFWDGGVLDRPGIAGMPAGRVLLHDLLPRSFPRRADMVTLVLDGMPRSGPFRIDVGKRALDLAREATLRALDAPIANDEVVVRVG